MTTVVVEFGMIGLMDEVEHDGTRAEVKRHTVSYAKSRTTLYRIGQSPPLNNVHTDCRSGPCAALQYCVGPKHKILDDGLQPVHVDDVIYLWLGRPGHG